MNLLKKIWCSSVGCKVLMSLTGLVLVGFLIAHLAGNLLVFKSPDALNLYAKTLREYLPILWALRIGLIVAFVIHLASAIRLVNLSRRARPISYKKRIYKKTTLSSRSMMLSGIVVLSFLVYHLLHLTFRLTNQKLIELGEYDVYSMLILSFQSPYISSFYVLSIILLMMHLSHGITSFFQTLGLNFKNQKAMQRMSVFFSGLLALGFISVPFAIFFGFIH